jgi:uncharacterized membrane protein SpoIIM required for sporulation/ABC-type transport system involved in multi-copper enzyme maturation permease subunit
MKAIGRMLNQLRPALVVTRREVRDQFRDWRIIIPIIVLTLIFPWLMNFTARQLVNFVESYGAPIIGDRLIPFLLMIVGFFPISISLVIALESFVGEKERHSIEPLISSPLRNWQLYFGKLLASLAPPLLAAYLGICVYLVGVYRQVGWVPDMMLLIQILALTAVQSLVMVSGAVVISSQTTSTRAANLLASFIIIPMVLLIQAESIIMFWGNYAVLWWAIFGQIIIAILLIRTGVAHFNREELLGREFDTLNIRWAWAKFSSAFVGNAKSPLDWIVHEIPKSFRRLITPVILVTFILLLATIIGTTQASRFQLPIDAFNLENLGAGFLEGLDEIRFFSIGSIGTIWLHNLRVLALATLLGIFSFAVLGIIVLMLPMMLIGYFTATVASAGISPWLFLTAFVLPHGVLEIPAIIIAGAAVLRMGAVLAAPSKNTTIGEAWLNALSDWSRVMIAIVLPLLLAAAALEVFITPQLAIIIFGN